MMTMIRVAGTSATGVVPTRGIGPLGPFTPGIIACHHSMTWMDGYGGCQLITEWYANRFDGDGFQTYRRQSIDYHWWPSRFCRW